LQELDHAVSRDVPRKALLDVNAGEGRSVDWLVVSEGFVLVDRDGSIGTG
jgi:hypothetical protein